MLPHDEAHTETVKSNALLKPVLKVFQSDRNYAATRICAAIHTHNQGNEGVSVLTVTQQIRAMANCRENSMLVLLQIQCS